MSTKTKPEHILARARPLGDRVVVKTGTVSEESPGGIILPQRLVARTKQQVGIVIATGPGKRLDVDYFEPGYGGDFDIKYMPMDVEVGDRVVFQMFAGDAIDDPDSGDDTYKILREEDILAILPKEISDDN